MYRILILGIIFSTFFSSSCKKADTQAPVITLTPDTLVHYLNYPYIDPGFTVTDNQSTGLEAKVIVQGTVDIHNYGSYSINYSVADENGNTGTASRKVDIVLSKDNYYYLTYAAYDSCTSGNFSYTGLVQDCNCPQNAVTVANISNFGMSALFTLPIDGQYNEIILMDTTKAAVSFYGEAKMSTGADTLFWNYSIADSVNTDVCSSVWIKQ